MIKGTKGEKMKQDMLNSVNAAIATLNGVFVNGESNVERMRDVFKILRGMEFYLNNLPEEEIKSGGE
jgi:hypothetical protein